MATHKVIIKTKHASNCFAMDAVHRGDWNTPWFIRGEIYWGSRSGNENVKLRHHRWQPFRCNDPKCPAEGLVSVDWLERLIFLGSRSAAEAAKVENTEPL